MTTLCLVVGRTALYRDPMPFKSAFAKVQLESDSLLVEMPDGWSRRHVLDGVTVSIDDAFVMARRDGGRIERRFVRMLQLEHIAVITPPERGAVAPNVVRIPEAPPDAAIVEMPEWDALAEWLIGGGRLGALSVADLARLACIATPQFAVLIGEVAARRALDLVWVAAGPLRGVHDFDTALQPLTDAARHSQRAGEALISALAHAAGISRRRRRVVSWPRRSARGSFGAMRFVLVALLAACQSTNVSRDVGARCDLNTECNEECLTGGNWPGGFCTVLCDSDDDCPSDTRCIDENGGGVCAFACAADPSCTFLGAYTCQMRDSHGGGTKVTACRG